MALDDVLAARKRQLLETAGWVAAEGVSVADFRAAVDGLPGEFLGKPNASDRGTYTAAELEHAAFYFSRHMPEIMGASQPTVAYGDYVTRLQPEGTVRIHAMLEERALPKERVLLSAPLPKGEFVVYAKASGLDFMAALVKMKWSAFTALGIANRAYIDNGVVLLDNGLDNWLYDGTTALRVDLGAAEVIHARGDDGSVRFPVELPLAERLQMVVTVAMTAAYTLAEERGLFSAEKYPAAMDDFLRGLTGVGPLPFDERVVRDQFAIHRELLGEALATGQPYELLLAHLIGAQGGAEPRR